jgi:hypothetical protein
METSETGDTADLCDRLRVLALSDGRPDHRKGWEAVGALRRPV